MQQGYSCPNCGSRVPFGARFCPSCGTSLSWPTQQQVQPPPVYQQQIQPPSYAPPSKGKTPKKWYAITTILALLFLASAVLAFSLLNTVGQYAEQLDDYARDLHYSEQLRLDAEASITNLQADKLELEQLVDSWMATAETAKFYFYYASLAKPQYGTTDLRDYLSRWQWVPGAYKHGKFDCSEMAACLERNLEIVGFRTRIIAGDDPSGSGEKHAWLLVETSPDKYMPVEATAYAVVEHDNPDFDNYFVYDYDFGTIQEALEIGPTEFNWWEK